MTYYLADTENIARRWKQYADKADPGDIFLLFYSANVGTVNMNLFGPACMRGIAFKFIECRTGPNAMDFQIATELGHMAAIHPEDRFVILSGDAGYDPVVAYWRDRNIDVERITPAAASAKTAKLPTRTIRDDYKELLSGKGLDSDDMNVAVGILCAAMAQPANKRKLDTYNRFQKRYGRVDGISRYRNLKDVVDHIAEHGPLPPQDKTQDQPDSKAPPKAAAKPIRKPDPSLEQAVRGLAPELTDAKLKKVVNMIVHAYNQGRKKNLYRKQLKESLGEQAGNRVYARTQHLI